MKSVIAMLGALSLASAQNCAWSFETHSGVNFSLDLSNYTDHVFHQETDSVNFLYSVCSNNLSCTHDGTKVYDMVSEIPKGVNECRHMASWEGGQNSPTYDWGAASWRFNYTNGAKCGQSQQNYQVIMYFDCNPAIHGLYFDKAYQFNDCGYILQFQYPGACEPASDDNEKCEFHAYPNTNLTLDLSSLKGQDLSYKAENNGGSWHYTPCDNNLKCELPNGNSVETMAQVEDSSNDCAKFLGFWSGDVQPHYFINHQGAETWSFSWYDGEECGIDSAPEMFEVFYVCDPSIDTYKVNATSAHNCHYSMEILTKLACTSTL